MNQLDASGCEKIVLIRIKIDISREEKVTRKMFEGCAFPLFIECVINVYNKNFIYCRIVEILGEIQ